MQIKICSFYLSDSEKAEKKFSQEKYILETLGLSLSLCTTLGFYINNTFLPGNESPF